MKIVETGRYVQTSIHYKVEGAMDVAISQWSKIKVAPDRVDVVRTDGELSSVEVSGYRVTKDGTVSDKARHRVEHYRSWSRELWPEWLTELVESSQ